MWQTEITQSMDMAWALVTSVKLQFSLESWPISSCFLKEIPAFFIPVIPLHNPWQEGWCINPDVSSKYCSHSKIKPAMSDKLIKMDKQSIDELVSSTKDWENRINTHLWVLAYNVWEVEVSWTNDHVMCKVDMKTACISRKKVWCR